MLPWGSLGAILGGPLFASWGYVHRESAPPHFDALANALSIIVPLLFSMGLAGFCAWRSRRAERICGEVGSVLALAGSILALAGCGLGFLYNLAVVLSVTDTAERYGYAASQGWPPQLLDWFPWLLLGLTLIGMAYVRTEPLRGWRFLPLSMGTFGWVYFFSDFGSTNQMRTAHILFGLLFSLCWVLLGYLIWLNRTGGQAKDSRA